MPNPKYKESMEKLEQIIRKIEQEEIEVDELAENIKEAVTLIKVCKDKIQKAELEVKQVVETFKEETEGTLGKIVSEDDK